MDTRYGETVRRPAWPAVAATACATQGNDGFWGPSRLSHHPDQENSILPRARLTANEPSPSGRHAQTQQARAIFTPPTYHTSAELAKTLSLPQTPKSRTDRLAPRHVVAAETRSAGSRRRPRGEQEQARSATPSQRRGVPARALHRRELEPRAVARHAPLAPPGHGEGDATARLGADEDGKHPTKRFARSLTFPDDQVLRRE